MSNLLKRAHQVTFGLALFVCTIANIFGRKQITLQGNGTTLEMTVLQLGLLTTMLLLILSALYFIMRQGLKNCLTALHLLMTSLSILIVLLIFVVSDSPLKQTIIPFINISLLLFLIAQLLFCVNILFFIIARFGHTNH